MLWALLALLALTRAQTQPELCALEKNQIKDLLQVSCMGKGLSAVPPDLPEDTGILLLRSNHLARVSTASFQHLNNLTDLDLSYNGMEGLKADAPLPGLQELDLSHNALKTLPILQGLPNLVRLALGHNALAQLPEGGFRALGRLADLELQGNRLQSLPLGAFEGLAALKDLDLSDNRLRMLPTQLLAGLGALETLRLERNQLRSVPNNFFPEGLNFQYVYLAENPWQCDCKLDYLRNWIRANDFSVYTRVQGPEKEITENEPESVRCQAPPKEAGQPVMEFQTQCRKLGDGEGLGDNELSEPWTGLDPPTILVPTDTPPTSPPSSSPPNLSSLDLPTTLVPTATPPASPPSSSPPNLSSLDLPTTLVPMATPPTRPPSSSPPNLSSLDLPTTLVPMATPPTRPPSPSPPNLSSLDLPTTLVPMATPPTRPPSSSPPNLSSLDLPTTLVPMATPPTRPPSPSPPNLSSLDPPTILVPTATPPASSPSPSPPNLSSLDPPTTLVPMATPPTRPPSPSPPNLSSLDLPTTLVPTATPPASSPSPSPPNLSSLDPPTTLVPTATPPASSPSPSPPKLGSLDATVRTATEVQNAPATTGARFTTRFLMPPPPPPPAHCQCPLPPGLALGLTSPQASPVPWGSCMTAPCCLLRLVLYVACLALVSLPTLAAAVLCCCGWGCLGWHPHATRGALGSQLVRYQQLEHATPKRGRGPREGCQPLPTPRFYHVCKRLEVRPLRHVSWLLISLPGPSGLWPWERKGRSPSYSLDRGKNNLQGVPARYAATTL